MRKRTSWPPLGVVVGEPLPALDFRYAEPVERFYCWDDLAANRSGIDLGDGDWGTSMQDAAFTTGVRPDI